MIQSAGDPHTRRIPGGHPSDRLTPPMRLLAILILVYVVSFVDRSIIGILAGRIKAELQLDDPQLGLLGGFAFVAFYATLGVPVAWLADRKSRVVIVSVSVAFWSLCTALCGLARDYSQLFLARMGVGVGEAGGSSLHTRRRGRPEQACTVNGASMTMRDRGCRASMTHANGAKEQRRVEPR
jgi:MFS family permease